MIWHWFHRRPWLGDVALVALLLFLGVGAAARGGHSHPVAIVLAVVQTLPLLLRRRWPIAVTLVVAATALAMVALSVWVVPVQLAVALYTLTSLRDRRVDRVVAGGVIAAVAVAVLVAGGVEFGAAAARVVFLTAAALLGDSLGSRRAYIREIEEKADRLEREQEIESRRAAAEEQARIARELHDVIAHALSVIVVQAGAADDLFDREPRRAREPIRSIDTAARAALADLRRVLGVLHGSADYQPQPGLDQLDRLIEQVRATGLHVTLEIDGAPRPLGSTLELSAYRIIQEALTNSIKHASAENVAIRLSYGDMLELDIHDDGHSENGQPHVAGSGLLGMQERVTLLGGTLTAGPTRGGGYRVAARLPIDAAA